MSTINLHKENGQRLVWFVKRNFLHFTTYVNQTTILYALNLYSDVSSLFFNKTGKKTFSRSREKLRINLGTRCSFPRELGEKHITFCSEAFCFQVVQSQNRFYLKKKEKNWLFLLPRRLLSKLYITSQEGAGLGTFGTLSLPTCYCSQLYLPRPRVLGSYKRHFERPQYFLLLPQHEALD